MVEISGSIFRRTIYTSNACVISDTLFRSETKALHRQLWAKIYAKFVLGGPCKNYG